MKVQAIVATDQKGGIGYHGAIPWDGDAPRDMKHFMNMTRNAIIIMGRITADSLKLPLKTRMSIIITTKVNETLERYGSHSKVVDSLESALELSNQLQGVEVPADTSVFIIGGSQIYNEAMNKGLIDLMHLTTIHETFRADTFFHFDKNDFELVSSEFFASDERNKYDCTFETFQKEKRP